MPDPLIVAGALLEHIDETGTTNHVDAVTLGVDKHVIGIAAGIEIGNDATIRGGQHQQPRGATKAHQNPMSFLIECHRKIRMMALSG